MSVMIDVPPALVQEASNYAALQGTSLKRLLCDYIEELAKLNVQNSAPIDQWRALVAQSHGRLSRPYQFKREDAYAK